MAIKVLIQEKEVECWNCTAKLEFLSSDELLHQSRRYLCIECPRCKCEIVTTRTKSGQAD
jgi:Zn finger protein HypA/HybF involved in hydrogenase expression